MPAVVEFETAPQMIARLAARYAGTGKAALGYRDREAGWTDVTWDDLFERVQAFAAFLDARGVGHGDRVAILSENRPEWAITDMAAQMLGAVTVALYATVPASQVAYIVRDSGAKVLVVSTTLQLRKADKAFDDCPDVRAIVSMSDPGKARDSTPVVAWDDALAQGRRQRGTDAPRLDARAEAVEPDDLSALIYTSGTTGEPKGVQMTHRNLMSNVHASHAIIEVFESDVHLSFLPLSHAFERTAGYAIVLSAGAKIVYAESVDTIAKNLPEVAPTLMVSVPRLFEKIYAAIRKSVDEGSAVTRGVFAWAVDTGAAVASRRKAGRPLGVVLAAQKALADRLVFSALHEKLGGNLRLAISGGAALPAEIGAFFEAAGVPLVEGYGLSETAPILVANPSDAPVYGTVGHVLPGVTIGIRDLGSGRMLAEVEGAQRPSRITTAPGEILARGPNVMPGYWNRPADTADAFDADGWFRTGDVGRFEDGYLRITDRIKHMIVSQGGKNIYPGPIEAAFASSPLVEQVMVVGEGREFLSALVVPELDALRAEVKAREIPASSADEILARPEVAALYDALFADHNRQSASHEKVRAWRFAQPFTVEDGLLTPTMKLRRRAIEARYAGLIDGVYA